MASITIRNLDDQVKEQLRIGAAHNGHSMEEEARLILGQALSAVERASGRGSRIHNRVSVVGGIELDVPSGRTISMADARIAAICRTHGASNATRNVRDVEFPGIERVTPWGT